MTIILNVLSWIQIGAVLRTVLIIENMWASEKEEISNKEALFQKIAKMYWSEESVLDSVMIEMWKFQ